MTKEEHPLPPPQREPSPALARMYSMGVSTTSEGVDNFARVSGSFMRSTTKNPLLNNDNNNTSFEERKEQQPSKDYHQDEEQEPSRFYQREQSLARKLKHHEHDNALEKKSFGRFLSFSSAKKKNQEERSLEEKKAVRRQSKVASAIQRVRTVREAASAAKRTRPKKGFAKGFRQVVDFKALGSDLITNFNVKFRRVFEILRCVDPDEDNEALSRYSLLHPKSPLYILWKRMINCLVMMVCFVLPALIAFNYSDMPALRFEQDLRVVKNIDLQKKEQLGTALDGLLLFVDICFCFDVLGNFFAPFFEEEELESKLVDDPWVVSYTYLTGWFLVDFLGSFPFDTALSPLVDADGVRFLELLGLFRLLRLYHVRKAWGFVERSARIRHEDFLHQVLSHSSLSRSLVWMLALVLSKSGRI